MKRVRRFLSVLLVALLALAALDESACFAETAPAPMATADQDGSAPQLPDGDHVCQHGHHHLMPMPSFADSRLAPDARAFAGVFSLARPLASHAPGSLERPPRA